MIFLDKESTRKESGKEQDNDEHPTSENNLIKDILLGVVVSPVRLVNEISNKVVYIGYHNIRKILLTAVGFNLVLIILDIPKIIKLNADLLLYGRVSVLVKLFSLLILLGILFLHTTKGLYIKDTYLVAKEIAKDSFDIGEGKTLEQVIEEEQGMSAVSVAEDSGSEFTNLNDLNAIEETPNQDLEEDINFVQADQTFEEAERKSETDVIEAKENLSHQYDKGVEDNFNALLDLINKSKYLNNSILYNDDFQDSDNIFGDDFDFD